MPSVVLDPTQWGRLEDYVCAVLERFKNDARVHVWDLWNEPGNYGDREAVAALLARVFDWSWSVRPDQPFTSGVSLPAEFDRATWDGIPTVQLESSDVISFHSYGPLDEVKERVAKLKVLGRPLLCTEYMGRRSGSTFQGIMPYFHQEKIGAYNWGAVAGKTQTNWPWPWGKGPEALRGGAGPVAARYFPAQRRTLRPGGDGSDPVLPGRLNFLDKQARRKLGDCVALVTVGIALGSNLGDSREELEAGVDFLRLLAANRLVRESPRIRTLPVDCPPGSPPFLNAVVELELDPGEFPPRKLLQRLQDFERRRGRPDLRETNAPRPLDLDIVYYGSAVIQEPDLIIPHPRAAQRRFVLEPLSALRPNLVLPGQIQTVSELLAALG